MAFTIENSDVVWDTRLLMPQLTLSLHAFYKTRSAVQHSAQDGQDSQSPSNIRISQEVDEYQECQGPQNTQIDHEHPIKVVECSGTQKTNISTVPLDILFIISELLDEIDSTCLALAVKNYYSLHRARHGEVSLVSHPDMLRPGCFRLPSSNVSVPSSRD
ncbi:hypothetical protein BDZ45DRAFT_680755 [Acephala macrosclerotiorum]|nr:hypothetical protein BDZ45DRAFT_680755 [Acephala macrosclerotiorum]